MLPSLLRNCYSTMENKAACCDECWLPKVNSIFPNFASELQTVPPRRPTWNILIINWSSVLLVILSWLNKKNLIERRSVMLYCSVQSNQLTQLILLTVKKKLLTVSQEEWRKKTTIFLYTVWWFNIFIFPVSSKNVFYHLTFVWLLRAAHKFQLIKTSHWSNCDIFSQAK